MAQGQLGAGLHLENPRVGAQQHVVIDKMAQALLFAEQAQQDVLDLAHALLKGAIGIDELNHRLDVFVPGRQHFGIALAQRNLPVAGLGPFGHGDQGLFVVIELFQDIAHAHVEQAQLAGQVIAVADVEGILDVPGQTFQMAQVSFDLQAQAQAVFTAQVGEEVVDLRVELEAIRAFGHRHEDVQADPHIQQAGNVLGRAVELAGGQLLAQFAQAQGALVEVLAQRLEQGPVFGEGAQDALGFDHRMVDSLPDKSGDCTASFARRFTPDQPTRRSRLFSAHQLRHIKAKGGRIGDLTSPQMADPCLSSPAAALTSTPCKWCTGCRVQSCPSPHRRGRSCCCRWRRCPSPPRCSQR
ncbi:hypothetical protein D9M71_180880 [compost metagenome]